MKAKFLALAALVLGLASCQTDTINGVKVDANGEAPVTIQVALPEATRAAGADSALGAIDNVNMKEYDIRFILEVYDAKGDLAKERQVVSGDETTATFSLRLVPGRHYRFVAWADFVINGSKDDLHYDTNGDNAFGLTKVELKSGDDQKLNDETRDAYTGVFNTADNNGEVFSSSTVVNFKLTRPFAKLRVVTNDMNQLYSELTEATVTYETKVYTSFDALSQEPGDDVDLASKTVEYGTDDTIYDNERNSSEKTLFADYLFGTEEDVISFTLDVEDETGFEIPTVNFNTSIPVQRNHLTTIYGPVLTDANNVTVTIDSDFEQPDHIVDIWDGESKTVPAIETNEAGEPVAVIDSASDLAWLADYVNGLTASTFATRADNEPVHFVLNADIDLDNQPWTPIGFNPNEEAGNEKYFTGTFDGNGHEIRNLNIDVKDKGGVGFFGAVNNATIKNLTLRNVFVKAVESENDPANSSGAEGKTNYIVGGHIGAVAGYDAKNGTVVFDNVHVKGLIKIEGETRAAQGQRVGGIIGGRSSSKYTFNNVSVIGEEGSYIKGYCSTAGVIGQGQEVATFTNVNTDIDVYAVTFGAGGIAGIARQGSTFTNCSTKGDVTLDASKTQLSSYSANYPYRVGGIAGCWSESKTGVLTLTNCSYEGNLISIDKDGNSPKAFDYAGYVGRGYALKNCAGSKVIIDGVEYVQAFDDVYGVYTVNGVYQVDDAADLKAIAAKVNAGDTFVGKTVKLTADIDLKNENWTPIGSAYMDHGFMGSFDGNGYAIKNLNISNITLDTDGYAYAGLFGVTEGVDQDNQNYIKNLVIENVNINTNGHIVAAAIAYPYYTVVENVTVKGNVSIKGGDYTAGVLAYTRRCVDAKDLAILAGTIEGNKTVGGVISDIQMNGGLTANYYNFKASGVTVKGATCVGGISGIICKQTLNGATVENATIVCDDTRKGIVAGSLGGDSTINRVSVNNVSGADNYVGATYDSGKSSKVTIDGVVYEYQADGSILVNGCQTVAYGVIIDSEGAYCISNKAGMFWFANEVNVKKNAFSGKTVKLTADIDLNNEAWTPVGQTGAITFNGVFDGQNYTISNLNVNSETQTGEHYSSGLFGWVESHTAGHGHIKNVKINGATIVGHHNCGALVGYITQETALVENCHVTGAAVTCTKANNDADGDKAGALIGNATVATPVKDCTAANSTVSAGRDAGQVIGAGKEANVTGCSATNVTVSANGTSTGANVRNEVIGRLLN